MMVFAAIFSLVSCGDQTEPDVPPVTYDAPSITWEGHDFDTPMEITEEMNVVIDIDVPAGIKSFVVDIDSDVLNERGISTIDFVNPADALQETIVALVLGEGQDITTATSLTLELSNLIPMILDLEPEANTDHIFTITIIYKENRTVEETCTFHYRASASVSVSVSVDETSIDLWKNTARVNVSNAAADVSYAVQYREKGTQTWYTASGNVTSGFILAPEYAQTSNAANLTVYTVKAGSGIYAKNIYEVRLMEGETEVSAIEFSTEGGDVIPNGDMSGWSMKVVEDSSLPYPNPDGQSFWDSGNKLYYKGAVPVVVSTAGFCDKITNIDKAEKVDGIRLSTVAGTKTICGFIADKLLITEDGNEKEFDNVIIGIGDCDFKGFSLLLNCDL